MADKQITELTAGTALSDSNVFLCRQAGSEDVQVTASQIKTYAQGGLGSIISQDSDNVTITGGTISGITDLAVTDGGTGASDAAGAKTNLGFMTDLSDDTTPQLGGDLDINGQDIISVSNGDINITPHGTGRSVVNGLSAPLLLNAQTGTSYTFVLADACKLVTFENASPITVTVPANASVAYTIGTQINLYQKGAGKVTVVGDGGVTVNTSQTLSLRAQNALASLIKIAGDEWVLIGDLESA